MRIPHLAALLVLALAPLAGAQTASYTNYGQACSGSGWGCESVNWGLKF